MNSPVGCPVCKSYEIKDITDPDFVRCTSCGLLRRSQSLSPDLLQSVLDEYHREQVSLTDLQPNRLGRALSEMPFIREYCSSFLSGGRALDIGCGLGDFLYALTQEGMRTIGLDASQQSAELARAQGFDVVVARFNRQALDTFFPDVKFDLISLRGAINYLDNPGEVFALARERLNRGGMLYISEHLASSPYYWFGAPLITRVGRTGTVFFDQHSLTQAFQIYGFSEVAASPLHFLPADVLIKAWHVQPDIIPLFQRFLPRMIRIFPPDYPCVLARITR